MENDGQKVSIDFSKYIKIKVHDPSSFWSSKSVHVIIGLGLCAPMILGLLFLVHNDIVVDVTARTVRDKKCNFNLLHPFPPPPPSPPKQKLWKFFKELQEDRKFMVEELNMGCNDIWQHTKYKFEKVMSIDKVAAIRERIEVLVVQKELQQLREKQKPNSQTFSLRSPI